VRNTAVPLLLHAHCNLCLPAHAHTFWWLTEWSAISYPKRYSSRTAAQSAQGNAQDTAGGRQLSVAKEANAHLSSNRQHMAALHADLQPQLARAPKPTR